MTTTEKRERAAVLYGPRDLRVKAVTPEPLRSGAVRVTVGATGICGSDLHYYADGRNGPNVLRSPTVLGHEAAGVVTELGEDTDPRLLGRQVAVEPARPCRRCPTCVAGRYNLCPSGTCFGSPPTHGTIRSTVIVDAELVHPVPEPMDMAQAALVEPLAVACWAVQRARITTGSSVLVTGAGPIGQLAVAAARAAGAATVVLADVAPERLRLAASAGADQVVDTGRQGPDRGFTHLLECSGAPEALSVIGLLHPGGTAVLVGVPAARQLDPEVLITAQRWEIDVRGSFRYGPEAFRNALHLVESGGVDLARMVTARFALDEVDGALRTALTDHEHLKIAVMAQDPA